MNFKNITVACVLTALSAQSFGGWENKCSAVKRVFSWAEGSDRYGIRATLADNPPSCSGFWIPHSSSNKQYVYSALLASAASGLKLCVQYDADQTKYDGMCRLNYVYFEAP